MSTIFCVSLFGAVYMLRVDGMREEIDVYTCCRIYPTPRHPSTLKLAHHQFSIITINATHFLFDFHFVTYTQTRTTSFSRQREGECAARCSTISI